jgi:transcriptional regulator with XRE-family HTH domain
MSFEDFSARMKAKSRQNEETDDRPFDFSEAYRIRAKMLGVLLRDAREGAARTIGECARLLGVSPAQIEAWEYGDDTPSLPQLELLAYYLDVPVSHFWGTDTLRISRAGRESIQPEYLNLRNKMIGAQLRQAREEASVTLEELSGTSGVPPDRINSYELGELAPPMHELSTLAGGVNKNVSYFLESSSQIGELLAMREAWKHFSTLPEDVRAFAADPVNIGFIHTP